MLIDKINNSYIFYDNGKNISTTKAANISTKIRDDSRGDTSSRASARP